MFETLKIGVALMSFEGGRILLEWNDNWAAFSLPMSKRNVIEGREEAAEVAAVRAAAEAVGRPCRVVPGKEVRAMRKLQLSGRDGEIRNYELTIVPVEVHPDYQMPAPQEAAGIMAAPDKLIGEEYQPMSATVKPVMDCLMEWSWL